MCVQKCVYKFADARIYDMYICIFYLLIQNSMHLFSKLFLHLRDIIYRSAAVITGFVPRFYAITEIE